MSAPPKRAQIVAAQYLTPSVKELTFEMIEPASIDYEPGSSIMLHVVTGKGMRRRRPYFFSSPPANGCSFALTFEVIPGDVVSEYVDGLIEGEEVEFEGPRTGRLCWRQPPGEGGHDVMLVGAGAGIAPLKSIFEYLLPLGRPNRIHFLWGLRHEDDIFYRQQLEKHARQHEAFSFSIVLSRPSQHWRGATGCVTSHLAKALDDLSAPLVFLAGNDATLDDAEVLLHESGVPRDRIHREAVVQPPPSHVDQAHADQASRME